MSEAKTAKIIHFPNNRKNEGSSPSTMLDELKSALQAAPLAQAADTAKHELVEKIVVNGDHAQVAPGGSITNNYTITTPTSRPKVVVKTGDGVLSAEQKAKLLELRDRAVTASASSSEPKTPAAVMKGLNRYMKVNAYAEIKADDFEKAVAWLRKQASIKLGLKSAPKKVPGWQNLRMQAIHARCKQLGLEKWRLDYMQARFGVITMKALNDKQLEQLYRAVMSKK